MTREQALQLAEEHGFTHAGIFSADRLRFLPEVRAMCAADRCGQYGKSWSCPPGCGTTEEWAARAAQFSWGVLLQTTAQLEDDFDFEAMAEAEKLQRARFDAFCGGLGNNEPHLAMGIGSCRICAACTWPDTPCRFPERMRPSMEACGLLVTDVCKAAGLPYYYGPRTLTYSCCVLF